MLARNGTSAENYALLIRQSAIMAAAAKDSRLKKRTLTHLITNAPPG
jgi:hypothetical protein